MHWVCRLGWASGQEEDGCYDMSAWGRSSLPGFPVSNPLPGLEYRVFANQFDMVHRRSDTNCTHPGGNRGDLRERQSETM